MRVKFLASIAVLGLLSGCATSENSYGAAAGAGAGVAGVFSSVLGPVDPGNEDGPLLATREYLLPSQKIADSEAPMKGVVLLRSGETKNNRRVCEAFLTLPPTASTLPMGISPKRITPTMWPVTSKPTDAAKCDELLRLYDFDTASIYFQHLQKASAKGPLLATVAGDRVAFIDLNKAKKKEIKSIVPAWSQALRANDGQDIVLQSAWLKGPCKAVGVNSTSVSAELLQIMQPGNSGLWKLINVGVEAAKNLVPFGPQAVKVAQGACKQFIA